MMREKIGGELIRWNATRFGTIFLLLQSFMDMRDKFEAWMVSSDWKIMIGEMRKTINSHMIA